MPFLVLFLSCVAHFCNNYCQNIFSHNKCITWRKELFCSVMDQDARLDSTALLQSRSMALSAMAARV